MFFWSVDLSGGNILPVKLWKGKGDVLKPKQEDGDWMCSDSSVPKHAANWILLHGVFSYLSAERHTFIRESINSTWSTQQLKNLTLDTKDTFEAVLCVKERSLLWITIASMFLWEKEKKWDIRLGERLTKISWAYMISDFDPLVTFTNWWQNSHLEYEAKNPISVTTIPKIKTIIFFQEAWRRFSLVLSMVPTVCKESFTLSGPIHCLESVLLMNYPKMCFVWL